MSQFTLLSAEDEDNLHAKRLLNIEEKPFKRIQKRLLAPTNPIQDYLRRTPVDGSNSQNGTDPATRGAKSQDEVDAYLKSLEQFTHATLHDFSSLTTSLARLQFLLSANQKERARYAQQSESITTQHHSIKEDAAHLRTRLQDAKRELEVRKGYDDLAEKVLWVDGKVGGDRAKTRQDLSRESDKLRSEIEELEREGDDLSQLWDDRRAALADVLSEGGRLRRVVRGEPEHEQEKQKVDDDTEDGRSEPPDDAEDGQKRRRDDDEDHILGVTEGRDGEGGISNAGTPRPTEDDAATPHHIPGESDALTPLPIPTIHENGGSMTTHETLDDADMADTPQPLSEQDSHHNVPEVKVDDVDKAEVSASEMDIS